MKYLMLTLLISAPTTASDEIQRLWGPPDRLNELLMASPQTDRVVERAFGLLERNDQAGAEMLLEVFAKDFDEFQPISETATGIRTAALKRLGDSPVSVKTLWLKSAEPPAQAELATVEPSISELLQLARRYPMTTTASQALRMAAAIEQSRGDVRRAARLRQEATQQIRGEFQTTTKGAPPVVAGRFKHQRLNDEFPRPNRSWEWHERTAGLPSGAAESATNPERFQNLIRRNSWVAGIMDQTVILRTPLRFVGISLNDGREQWSLKTESLHDQFQSPLQNLLGPQLVSADWMNTCVAAWWTLSDRRLFFVDGQAEAEFRTGFEHDRLPNADRFGVRLRRNFVMGSRLVAAQVTDSARTLWQVGGRGTDGTEFQDHLFCGPPACSGSELFVISSFEKTSPLERIYFLNALDASTGRLNWRCPLAVGQPRGLVSQQEFAVCSVVGDIVTCVLNDRVVVSVHRLDGRLLNATTFGAATGRERFSVSRDVGRAAPARPPVAATDAVIHVQRSGNWTVCVNVIDGEPRWTVDRVVDGAGILEGSRDLFPIGVTETSVLVAGSRHIRCLDLNDGQQRWIVEVEGVAGQPLLTDSSCLVSTPSGQLLRIEVASGLVNRIPFQYAAGSLVASAKHLLFVAADSVIAFPRIQDRDDKSALAQLLVGRPDRARKILQDSDKLSDEQAELLVRLTPETEPIPSQTNRFETARRLGIARGLTREQQSISDDDLNSRVRFNDGREVLLRTVVAMNRPTDNTSQSVADQSTRELAAGWIVAPEQAAVSDILKLVDQLEQSSQSSAADLLLSSAQLAFPSERLNLDRRQRELRADWIVPAPEESPVSVRLAEDNGIEETLQLESDDEVWRALNGMDVVVQTPAWYRCKLLQDGRSLACFDQQTGTITGRLRLPEQCQFGPIRPSSDLPGIVPFVSVDSANRVMFGAIGLLHQSAPALLWHRLMPFRKDDSGYCRLAGFSARHMMVQSKSYLYCLHPLTGELMWSRPFSTWNCSPDNDGLNRTLPFGDTKVVGLFGPRQRHATIFRPADGKLLHRISLEDHGTRALISDRTAVYPVQTKDGNWRVRLQHLDGSEKPALADQDEVSLPPGGNVVLLKDSQAACLDQQRRLVLMDLEKGTVKWRTNLDQNLPPESRFTVNVFQIREHLIVNLRHSNRRNFYGESGSRWHERRLMPGYVACVNRDDGRLRWLTLQKESAVVQPIFGDAAPFLMSWSRRVPTMNGLFERRLGPAGLDYSLRLDCRDLSTGDIVAQAPHLHTDEPYHCFFDSGSRRVVIRSRRSTVALQFEP